MPTPQMTLRVEEERMARWKEACAQRDTNVSEQIRLLMDDWSTDVLGPAPEEPAATVTE